MTCYKVYLTLSALIICHVSANNEYERPRVHLTDISQIPRNSQYDVYETASSEVLPYYSDNDGSSEDRLKEAFASPSERSLSVKRGPRENKSSKKPLTSSLYASYVNKEPTLPRSGVAHCQEIKAKGKEGEPLKNVTCYRCKDPSSGSTYERCFHHTELEWTSPTVNAKVEHRPPGNFRQRRSDDRGLGSYGEPRNPYRFAEKYFTDATYDAPIAREKNGEKCDKIVKNSMVCIVCKDAKTNGKYEQCSYVKQPLEKAYSYVQSTTSGKPQERRNDDENDDDGDDGDDDDAAQRQSEVGSYSQPSDVQEYDPSKSRGEFSPEKTNQRDETEETSSADCKQVQRDSKTCTVCKDSKTGGTYEKCSYNYQPRDKLYKYSRSKSFGYPDKIADSTRRAGKITQASDDSKRPDYSHGSESTREDAYFDKPAYRPYSRGSDKIVESESARDSKDASYGPSDYSNEYYNPGGSDNYTFASSNDDPESYEATPSSSDSAKSDSEDYSADINQDYCKKVQRDSMTCTVCQDPKTGNDFERCSYAYEPSDKLFSYSKSKSFNSSRDNDKAPREDEQSEESSDSTRGSYERAPETYEASATDEARSEDDEEAKIPSSGYAHTAKKKAEIEGFLRDFRKEDRSKCKKIIRDRMTCYQCVDDGGAQKEECVFVAGREPDKEQLAFHEVKEFQIGSASRVNRHRSPGPRKTAEEDAPVPLEPTMSASKNSRVKIQKPDSAYPDEVNRNDAEETKGAEPYDYTSETRSRYDKVLGLTLPAYMFATSEHEAAFDEVMASSQEQR